MSNEVRIQTISEQLQIMLLFLERPVIQQQLMALLICFVGGWLLTDGVWYLGKARLLAWGRNRFDENQQQYWYRAVTMAEYLSFPALGIFALAFIINSFQTQGWVAQLLVVSQPVMWAIFLYRFGLALLHVSLGGQMLHRYHYRLLLPLFILFLLAWVGSNLLDVSILQKIELFTLFTNPITVGSLLFAAVTLYFLINGAWATQDILHGFIMPRTAIDPGMLNAALTIGRYIVICIGILIVLGAVGFDPTTLTVIGGGLSVGIGFGMRTIVANFISGVVLLFEQSLRPGDVVRVEDLLGTVDKLSIRATTVKTFDNIEIIVPNEILLTSSVTTYTQSSRVIRVVMTISTSYESDPKVVMEILLNIAREHGLVLDDPEPLVFFQAFGESSLDFHLAIWIEDPMHMKRVPSDLRLMIWKQFEKHDIRIPYPQRDLHIRSGMPWQKAEEFIEIQLPGANSLS